MEVGGFSSGVRSLIFRRVAFSNAVAPTFLFLIPYFLFACGW